jgi:protein-disulfide isomerase
MQEQKNNFMIPASILLAGFLIAGGIYLSNKGNNPVPVNTNPTQNSDIVINPVSKTDHILGNPDAPVVIVEFSDTECPYCKMFQTTMQTVMNTYGKDGKVAWVYRYFPLDQLHSKSRNEAQAVECSSELGGSTAFWKYLDEVYSTTTSNDTLDPAKLPIIAKYAGLDVTKFNTCLASGKYANLIQADLEDGAKAGAQGTPYNVMILKNAVSDDVKSKINDYVSQNRIYDQSGNPLIFVSTNKKEVVLGGAMPIEVMKAVLDIILK